MLHINQDEVDGVVKQLELDFGDYGKLKELEQLFVCRRAGGRKIDSIEWQAQYFASCLLMPKSILEEKRKGRDLTKWSNLYQIRDELGVSISNLTYRLQEFGWISIPKGSRTIYRGPAEVKGQTQLFG